VPLTLYASVNANPLKVAMMRSLGAEVVLEGADFDAAKLAGKAHAAAAGGVFLEDGFDPEASEGAGTIGLELMQMADPPDTLLVPLGNGAMLTGIARWVKAARPATRVIGVQATGADAMEKSWRSGTVVIRDRVETIADGIGVRVPVPEALDDMKGLVDEVVLVTDDHIRAAMRLLFDHAGLMAEPSAGAALAPLIAAPDAWRGAHVGAVICGANLTADQVRAWLI
jgi:threonine dehydratase